MTQVELLGKGIVTLKVPESEVGDYVKLAQCVRLKTTVLDRQVLDHEGVKVVRANDILLGKVQDEFAVVSIDISFRGILRRMGIEDYPLLSRMATKLIPWRMVTLVDSNMPQLKLNISQKSLEKLHPADIANLVEELNVKRGADLVSHLDPEVAAEVLEEVDEDRKMALIEHLGVEKAGDILEDMSPDQAADILDDLPDDKALKLIAEIDPKEGKKILDLIHYDDDQAGGLMTTDYVGGKPEWTVKQMRKHLAETEEDIPTVSYIYLTDQEGHYAGVLSLRTLATAHEHDKLADLMTTDVFSVGPETSIKQIANYLTKYNLFSIAVVDQDKKLLGIVMVDDIMRELVPEA